jgi:uncharacterized repeat protein (TIGR02543 family)
MEYRKTLGGFMKKNLNSRIVTAGIAILALAALFFSGCPELLPKEEAEAKASWLAGLSPEEAGSHVVQFITSNVSGVSVVAAPIKYVRPPAVKIDALPANPTRSGTWTFLGWYDTAAEEGGVKFTADTAIDRDWKLYTRWFNGTPATIVFNLQGGSIGGNTANVTKTVTPPETTVLDWPPNPDPPGANPFSGWYTAQNGGLEFTPATQVAFSVTTTVYAQYGDKYTVTFDKNGGDTEASPATVAVFGSGSKLASLPTAPTRALHSFAGWYTVPETIGGTQFTAGGSGTPITASITVYARWEPAPTVTFDANGGTPATQTKTVTKNTAVGTLPTVTRKGYRFVGWFDTAAATGGTQLTTSTVISVDRTVYARWKDLLVQFLFNNRSGTTYKDNVDATITATIGGTNSTNRYGTVVKGGKTFYYYRNHNSTALSVLNLGNASTMGSVIGSLNEEFTIAVYVYVETAGTGAGRMLMSFWNDTPGSSAGRLMYLHAKNADEGYAITMSGWGSSAEKYVKDTTTNRLTLNTWHHVAYTQTGKTEANNGKLYIDGVLVKEGTIPLLPADLGNTANNFFGSPPYSGDSAQQQTRYTDFRLYCRALSAEEITAAFKPDLDLLQGP